MIAVDGPAASGKGTIARALARHFDLPHMDTGMLYRAVALNLWRWGGDPGHEFEALKACDVAAVDPEDPELRTEVVGGIASRVSAYPAVRAALLERQREFAAQPGGAVLDGRDIGTVIVPRCRRQIVRHRLGRGPRRDAALGELAARGMKVHLADVLIDISARDERDAGRDVAPLMRAKDADLLDTSDMSADEAIAAAIALVEKRLAKG